MRYQSNEPLEKVISDIADFRYELGRQLENNHKQKIIEENLELFSKIAESYTFAKDRIIIRLVDNEVFADDVREGNLVTKPFNEDFDSTYKIKLFADADSYFTATLTKAMLLSWGIDLETLHHNAVELDRRKNYHLICGSEVARSFIQKTDPIQESVNLLDLDTKRAQSLAIGEQMFSLFGETLQDLGANAILHKDILKQIGDIFDTNYFVLPSSVNDLVIVPDTEDVDIQMICKLPSFVSGEFTDTGDFLSNKTQYYDRTLEQLVNAENLFLSHAFTATYNEFEF